MTAIAGQLVIAALMRSMLQSIAVRRRADLTPAVMLPGLERGGGLDVVCDRLDISWVHWHVLVVGCAVWRLLDMWEHTCD